MAEKDLKRRMQEGHVGVVSGTGLMIITNSILMAGGGGVTLAMK